MAYALLVLRRDGHPARLDPRAEPDQYPSCGTPGSLLPSGRVLADEYDVSQSTISRAVATLRKQGVLVGRPGRGVFVAEPGKR
ncbi:hypothetical protein C7C45_27495 [Micromonospora arborensis]|uniref:HTH gntR-type domain-containing protein n=1 Tax=Micromonospora arborensis TaxID=2116518 RepID=A0A318NGX9_9ACTN|nr:hypothetical protein C7C45_27495 [Micromonospora arborensis]